MNFSASSSVLVLSSLVGDMKPSPYTVNAWLSDDLKSGNRAANLPIQVFLDKMSVRYILSSKIFFGDEPCRNAL